MIISTVLRPLLTMLIILKELYKYYVIYFQDILVSGQCFKDKVMLEQSIWKDHHHLVKK